jgi:hypothetical protein
MHTVDHCLRAKTKIHSKEGKSALEESKLLPFQEAYLQDIALSNDSPGTLYSTFFPTLLILFGKLQSENKSRDHFKKANSFIWTAVWSGDRIQG